MSGWNQSIGQSAQQGMLFSWVMAGFGIEWNLTQTLFRRQNFRDRQGWSGFWSRVTGDNSVEPAGGILW